MSSRRGLSLADISPKFLAKHREEIERQLQRPKTIAIAPAPEIEAAPAERRIRQSRAGLNKLETAYQDVLRFEHGAENVKAQSIRLLLANGLWYKPDFYIPKLGLMIEVKGPRAFRGGFENLKMAARAHPNFKFRLVWRVSGQWKFQEVLP